MTVELANNAGFRDRLAKGLNRTIFWGLLTLMTLTAVPFGTLSPLWEALFESAVFCFAMSWLIDGWLRNSFFTVDHKLLLPLFGVVVLALLQTIPLGKIESPSVLNSATLDWTISADPFETLRFAFKCLALTLFLGLLLRYVSTEKRMLILAYVIVAIAVGSVLFGLVRSQIPQLFVTFEGSNPQFQNRNHFALLMEMALGVALGLGFAARTNSRRILYVASGIVLGTALLMTHSRGGVLTLIVEVPAFFLLYSLITTESSSSGMRKPAYARLLSPILLMVLVASALAASVIVVGGDETFERFVKTPEELVARRDGAPKLQRPQIWVATLKLVGENTPLGVGFAAYSVAIPRYLKNPGEWTPAQAHNEYLELIASGGVIGAALGCWFVVSFMKLGRTRVRQMARSQRLLVCGALAGLIAVALHSFFDFGLHITLNSVICAGLIVLAVKTPQHLQFAQYERA